MYLSLKEFSTNFERFWSFLLVRPPGAKKISQSSERKDSIDRLKRASRQRVCWNEFVWGAARPSTLHAFWWEWDRSSANFRFGAVFVYRWPWTESLRSICPTLIKMRVLQVSRIFSLFPAVTVPSLRNAYFLHFVQIKVNKENMELHYKFNLE